MRVPLSWLTDYVETDAAPEELAHRLTMAGVECEGIERTGEGWDGIVVGLVTAVEPHPNADRLRLATVDHGDGVETVVCGAPNVAPGQKVAFAHVGARLIDAHTGERRTLRPARIRGVESRGMVCSERELGLSEEHEGILVLRDDAPVGRPLADLLGDVVLDLSVTPNRPDCLSVLGVAREVAAVTGREAREPDLAYEEAGPDVRERTRVEILDPDLCPRYIAAVVTGVRVGPSPAWMQERLAAAGMRPINVIVDVTNYVMLEYGQPLHAFDYDTLRERRIVVRRAREGEGIRTIDGQDRRLRAGTLVIADAERPVAIAGVMGGADTEVSEGTASVLLESACFNQASIRATSRALGLRSEASLRFERGLSPDLPLVAARRATQLLVRLAGGRACRGMVDVYPGRTARPPLRLRRARARRVLGADVSADEMARVLRRLGFGVERDGRDILRVTAPYWRTDVTIEDDLIEEVVRIKGYDWVPTAAGVGRLPPHEPQPMLALKDRVRDLLAGAGLQEVITYPLTSPDAAARAREPAEPPPLRVRNPMTADLVQLRTSLRGSLLHTLASNQRNPDLGVRLFEVGRVYLARAGDLPHEEEMVAGVLSGPRSELSWHGEAQNMDFYDGKGVLEALLGALGAAPAFERASDPLLHPGRTARVTVGGEALGLLGEVHPVVAADLDLLDRPAVYFELSLERLLPHLPGRARAFQALPRFPGLVRDLALIVDASVPARDVAAIIEATPLVRSVTLFDVYRGGPVPEGKRQLAYRLVFQAPDRTLTSEEADRAQERLLARLRREVGATLRG